MGVGYVIWPYFLLIFFIIPVVLFFVKTIPKKQRVFILSIPIILTLLTFGYAVFDTIRANIRVKNHPEYNRMTFTNSITDVRDSLVELKQLLNSIRIDNDMNIELSASNYFQWEKYLDSSISLDKKIRLLKSVQYLQTNNLNRIELNNGSIFLRYYDTIFKRYKFRPRIVTLIDTSGKMSYNKSWFDTIEVKEGLLLLSEKQ